MNTTPLAVIFLFTATLILALCFPLILRRIPMNRVYGVRFPQSFRSDQLWYDINCYGEKCMAVWTIPIYVAGMIGLIFAEQLTAYSSIYSMTTAVITCLSICMAVLITHRRAKQLDKQNKC